MDVYHAIREDQEKPLLEAPQTKHQNASFDPDTPRTVSNSTGEASVLRSKVAAEKGRDGLGRRKSSAKATPWRHPGYSQVLQEEWADASGRSQSLGSMLDYGSPADWLRKFLKQPEARSSRFTEIPSRDNMERTNPIDKRRPSEPLIPSNVVSRRQTGRSTFSGRSALRIDSFGFKRAVNDLERLLGEALTLASQVVDHSETPGKGDYTQASNSPHSRRRNELNRADNENGSSCDELFTSAHESLEEFSDVDLDETAELKRPGCRHAATYCGLPQRPKLAEIVQTYSTPDERLETEILGSRSWHESDRRPSEHAHNIPVRTSSMPISTLKSVLDSSEHRSFNKSLHSRRKIWDTRDDDLCSSITEVVDFSMGKENHRGENTSPRHDVSPNDVPAIQVTDEDPQSQNNATGRRLHAKHIVNLRRRSHVSLRNTQGFSLVKSHKRHPIARD